jgi:hypothetical protein
VYERGRDCGTRFHGDLQGIENWSQATDALEELRDVGAGGDLELSPMHELELTNGWRSERLTFDRPILYLVKRGVLAGSLDQALKRQALAASVEIVFGETVPPETANLIATGPDPHRVFALDKGIVFTTSAPDMAVGLVNDRAAYRGYSYLLIAGGYGCLCSVLFDRFERIHACLEEAHRLLIGRRGIGVTDPRHVGGIGHFSLRREWRTGTGLRVGEAAGLQDLLWGFGIRTAIASGRLAARCILDGSDYGTQAEGGYGAWKRAGMVNRFLWEMLRWRSYAAVLRVFRRRARGRLRALYGYHPLQRMAYPVARLYLAPRRSALGF